MQLAWLVVLAVLIASNATGQPQNEDRLPLTFSTPAQADGQVRTAGGESVLLFFRDTVATAHLAAHAFLEVNRTFLHSSLDLVAHQVGAAPGAELPPQERQPNRDVDAELLFQRPGWMSLFIAAAEIQVDASGISGHLVSFTPGSRIDSALQEDYGAVRANPGDDVVESAAAGIAWTSGTGEPTGIVLEAQGITEIRWSSIDLQCSPRSWCPDAAKSWSQTHPSPSGDSVTIARHSFTVLRTTNGTLSLEGYATAGAMVGQTLQMSGNGHLRLPQSARLGNCPAGNCFDPEGATLIIDGTYALQDVEPVRPATHLAGTLSGQPAAARLDETAIDPGVLWGQPTLIGTGAVAVALVVGWRLVGLLFSRHGEQDVLQLDSRRRLYRVICDHPGQTYRALMRLTDLSDGGARHHLAKLETAGLIVRRPHAGRHAYFENHGRFDGTWRAVALLQHPGVFRLRKWIEANPGASQMEIVDHAKGTWGDSRKTTQKRLARLLETQIIQVERQGRVNQYSLTNSPTPTLLQRLRFGPADAPALVQW